MTLIVWMSGIPLAGMAVNWVGPTDWSLEQYGHLKIHQISLWLLKRLPGTSLAVAC